MQFDGKRYIIGIDLGTTNSAVSYVDLEMNESDVSKSICLFNVPQLVGPGEFKGHSVLPSFLYIPGPYDIASSAVSIPWEREVTSFAGVFARDHGAKVPARLVASAKSWLCHGDVDRRAKILPWGSGEEIRKVSPVEATSAYLSHIKKAWNSKCGDDEERYLENQLIILTVPASFDEVARDLTVEAAKLSGLNQITLIEEPLAAFYNWLIKHEKNWDQFVKPNELILICDVGGGTTDFTLIFLKEVEGSPRFERIAVGDHLILGGDNIDLALAHQVEMASGRKKISLNQDRWKTLCHQCRQAKENILNNLTDSVRITIMGEGSSLIAGTLSAELNRKNLEKTIMDGFFPLVKDHTGNSAKTKKGITEFGLPYEHDPAITRHLGEFLERHKEDVKNNGFDRKPIPDLILFNGGSLKSPVIQERIRHAIRYWFGVEDESIPRILENPEPDLAVALGASYYGMVKTGKGVRVGSGSPRGYYIGVAKQEEGMGKHAVCLVERGLDEGTHIHLPDKQFEVLTNQPVTFDAYSSSYRSGDKTGDIVQIDDSFSTLPPIQTIVQFGKKGVKTTLPVTIEADYTEIGTLSLWCSSQISKHRWQLQFQLRSRELEADVSDTEVFDSEITETVCMEVKKAFSNQKDKKDLEGLSKMISVLVDRPRDDWPLSFIRRISDELITNRSYRKLSPLHEHRWLNLAGFTMRPGFGDGFDEQRIKSIWKIYNKGRIFSNNQQVGSEWWILWRRIAGGLKPGQQRQFMQDVTPLLFQKKGAGVKVSPQQLAEIWMAIANMEKLLVKDKIKLGRQLLSEVTPKTSSPQLFWALSRIGSRVMLYGSSDRVVPSGEITIWIKKILEQEWPDPKSVGMTLIQLARKTGDRARDIESEILDQTVMWLSQYELFHSRLHLLKEVIPIQKKEQTDMFGESLPTGLVLSF
ncbi:MAG: molecular chaperone DnaK [Desulfobacterium sp.]|nr:molecular chaperone DnaK [Desulfobacterium sp.]